MDSKEECTIERRQIQYVAISPDELAKAIEAGFINALNSPNAVEAVEGAVTRWFDQQSGNAMRRVLNGLVVGSLLLLAINFSSIKTVLAKLAQ